MLLESRQPVNLIVVDSSDQHEPVKQLVQELTKGWPGNVVILYESLPSSSRQRNIGLDYVTSDVVIFPDDDSLILPGAFLNMMNIYDLDTNYSVSGVCSAEALLPPVGLIDSKESYKLSLGDKIHKQVAKWRYSLERLLIPDPLLIHGKQLTAAHPLPAWLELENAVPVEYMTGFRMSFRTQVIKKYKFTEVFSGYCLAEDVGASFLALRDGLLIGARNAQIYHHKFPSRRANGYFMGLVLMINNAYVLSKSMEINNQKVVFACYAKSLYKLFLYLFGLRHSFGRARFRGAARGIWVMWKLFKVKGNELDSAYTQEWQRSQRFLGY